jgi:Flp pilus assembly protein CpaB
MRQQVATADVTLARSTHRHHRLRLAADDGYLRLALHGVNVTIAAGVGAVAGSVSGERAAIMAEIAALPAEIHNASQAAARALTESQAPRPNE